LRGGRSTRVTIPAEDQSEYPDVDHELEQLWMCNDCGSSAIGTRQIRHFPSCEAGSARRWEKYYKDPEIDDYTDPTKPKRKSKVEEADDTGWPLGM
jgi:hypothetical protein